MNRRERLVSVLESDPPEDESTADNFEDPPKRYLIVQSYDGPSNAGSWLVNVDSLESAAEYAAGSIGDGSSYVTDRVVDLDTGAEFFPKYSVAWVQP